MDDSIATDINYYFRTHHTDVIYNIRYGLIVSIYGRSSYERWEFDQPFNIKKFVAAIDARIIPLDHVLNVVESDPSSVLRPLSRKKAFRDFKTLAAKPWLTNIINILAKKKNENENAPDFRTIYVTITYKNETVTICLVKEV